MSETRFKIEQIQIQIKDAADLAGVINEILEVGSSEGEDYAGAVRLLETVLNGQAQELGKIAEALLREEKEGKAA